MTQPAYSYYFRRTVPSGDDASALGAWLATELNTVQRAIPFRTTKTVTASYTLTAADDMVLVDATAGAVTITFPDPTAAQHGTWTVKKIDSSSNAVTFASTIAATSTAATFDGVTDPTLVSQWDSKTERSNGVEYYTTTVLDAIVGGSVPAADVTSGTFGSASSDVGTYTFSHAMTVTGLATVGSLAIGATGKGFSSAGALSATTGAFSSAFAAFVVSINGENNNLRLDADTGTNAEMYLSVNTVNQIRIGLLGAANTLRIRDEVGAVTIATFTGGSTVLTGTLDVSGDFSIATSKFTVAASSGNTVVAGTLGVTGQVTIPNGVAYAVKDTGGTVRAGLSLSGAAHWQVGDIAGIGFPFDLFGNPITANGPLVITGSFGCNGKSAQGAFASGGAATTTGSTNIAPYGFTTPFQADGIVTLLNNIRAALVANGIMS